MFYHPLVDRACARRISTTMMIPLNWLHSVNGKTVNTKLAHQNSVYQRQSVVFRDNLSDSFSKDKYDFIHAGAAFS